jgi:hypothetical protein
MGSVDEDNTNIADKLLLQAIACCTENELMQHLRRSQWYLEIE